MKRENLKQKLSKYYSKDMVKSILSGRRKPNYKIILELNGKHKVPFTAWKDIKSFISKDNNSNKSSNT